MMKKGRVVLQQSVSEVLKKVETLAMDYKSIPMMARTHGQPASPTTVGKEFINFAWRIKEECNILSSIDIEAKINGATGNYNAHHFVQPDVDWVSAGQKFVQNYLELKPLLYTIQINPNHYISEMLHSLSRLSATLIDLNRDIWGYISFGYFKQKLKEGEVGSSTMPHKVNPIDFENSEGNLGIAISLMEHMAIKLLNSRFQRDLSDSTVLRNLGAIYGYILIGLKSTLKGLNKLDLNESKISVDLADNLELLAEPIQTAMRMYGEENPYEKLKSLTRGAKIDQATLDKFIDQLQQVPEDVKQNMKELTPSTYLGVAEKLVDVYFES